MLEFDARQARVLRECVERCTARLRREVLEVTRAQMRGFEPPAVREVLEELDLVGRQLGASGPPVEVHGIHARLVKSVVHLERRSLATEIDAPRQRTAHRDAIRYLEADLRVLDAILLSPSFTETVGARLPRLTDFLSIRHAEAALGLETSLATRTYDDKFSILEAPSSFLPDLAHYRRRCELRGASLCVGFVDIDDFKTFNTRYGETKVDRDLLPHLMELFEAHVFGHGHAYRFGGDEYVLLLPNVQEAVALEFIHTLQERLAALELPGIRESPTISAGLAHVQPDCFLTDREVQERANRAKNHAKAEGKDRIAHYSSPLFRDTDLTLWSPSR